MSTSSLRTVVLSTLPLETRESLLFSLASEIDPNMLHFSLLPDADNANRDPNTPVVAVSWKLSRQHPILSKIGGMEVPQYGGDDSFLHNNNTSNHPFAVITPRKMVTPQKQTANSRQYRNGISASAHARRTQNNQQQRTASNQNRVRTSSANSSTGSNNNHNNQRSTTPVTIEQILTVSPVIRGSPTPFQKQMMRRPSPFSAPGGAVRSNSRSRQRNHHCNNNHSEEGRSPQWAQRHVEDFLHFAAKSGVDTVQHNSVAFALQCFLQYQSAVASTIRHDFHDLQVAVEAYNHVCPASRLLHFLWKECDDFSGVAALSYLSSIRFNDQVVSPRQIVSLASKVQTVAGHTLLINRKYLRVNETVAVLRQATRKWNIHAAGFAKRQILSFLKSYHHQNRNSDPEVGIAFDYVRHVDLYAFLLQLGRCYVLTNAGRSGPVTDEDPREYFAAQHQQNQNNQQQQYHQEDKQAGRGGGIGTSNTNGDDHVDPYSHPEKVGGDKYQQNAFYQEQQAEGSAARQHNYNNNTDNNAVRDISVSPNTPAPNTNNAATPRQQQENTVNRQSSTSPIPAITPFNPTTTSTSSYANRFEEKRQLARQKNNDNLVRTTSSDEQKLHPRSYAWSQRISSAQNTLKQVMKQFDDVSGSPSPRRSGKHGYLREERGNSSPAAHSAGRLRIDATQQQQQARAHSSPNNNNYRTQQQRRGESLRESLERQVGVEEQTGKPIMGRDRGHNNNNDDDLQNEFVTADQRAERIATQQQQQQYRSPSQEPVETVVIGSSRRNSRQQNQKASSVSASNPRARSHDPPAPTPDADLDPISAALAEQVKKTLESRRQILKSESRDKDNNNNDDDTVVDVEGKRTQLEMIASP